MVVFAGFSSKISITVDVTLLNTKGFVIIPVFGAIDFNKMNVFIIVWFLGKINMHRVTFGGGYFRF